MTWLNQLMSEGELAKLTQDERDFMVRRMEYQLDTNPEIARVLSSEINHSLRHLGHDDFQGAKAE
jgi:hypothetical protein